MWIRRHLNKFSSEQRFHLWSPISASDKNQTTLSFSRISLTSFGTFVFLLIKAEKVRLHQALCRHTDSPSERSTSSSRSPPEHENVPQSVRPTKPSLQTMNTALWTQHKVTFKICKLEGKVTFLTWSDVSEKTDSGMWWVWWFNQVTCVWVGQDGQQVAVPCSLHHLLHLENRDLKSDGSTTTQLGFCLVSFSLQHN